MAEEKKEEIAVIEITEEYMKERIYEIRGQRVILDSDLSEIYGYTTKAFNQQVKNNIEKFDEDFMFELTDDEVEDLRSNFLTARQRNCWYLQRLRNALCWQIRLQGITFTRHSFSLINCMLK